MIQPNVLQHLIQLRDLSEVASPPSHAIALMVQRISRAIQERWPKIPLYDIRGPRMMRTQEEFDNLLIPANHPQRASCKIHYLSENRLLRSHMTPLLGRAVNIIHDQGLEQAVFLMPGICYLRTLPAPERIAEPHKLDIWLFQSPQISQQSESTLLEEVEVILQGIFQEKHWRSRAHTKVHPYTDPGFSIEVSLQPGLWVKILECGQASAALLQKQGIDPRQSRVSAFGLGLDRCVMAVKELNDIRLLRHPSPWIQEQMLDLTVYHEQVRYPSFSTEQTIPPISSSSLVELFEQFRWERPSLFNLIAKTNSFQDNNALRLNMEWHSPVKKISFEETNEGIRYISNLADKIWRGQ